jgi:hypothetical protein
MLTPSLAAKESNWRDSETQLSFSELELMYPTMPSLGPSMIHDLMHGESSRHDLDAGSNR